MKNKGSNIAALCGATIVMAATSYATQVFIGGGDNSAGAFDKYLAHPEQWTFTRANASGFYINTFALTTDTADVTQNGKLSQMRGLFANDNVFYETDYLKMDDYSDKVKIDILRAQGWNVAYATCNRGLDANRISALQWRAWRPVLAMIAPWTINGDITTDPNAEYLINICSGSATDGPMGYWWIDYNQMHTGSYSMANYSHLNNKKAMCMIAPYSAGQTNWNDTQFLRIGQICVRQHENNSVAPELWAISYYAAQVETHAVTPESNSDGSPYPSVTGMAYWLINHLRGLMASMDINSAPGLVNGLDHKEGDTVCHQTKLDFPALETRKSVTYDISNNSKFFEYCPVLQAKINNPGSQFKFTIKIGDRDFTRQAVKEGGLIFVNDLRLMPQDKQKMTLTIERDPAAAATRSAEMASVKFTLFAHPTEMERIVQTAELDINTTTSSAQLASNR